METYDGRISNTKWVVGIIVIKHLLMQGASTNKDEGRQEEGEHRQNEEHKQNLATMEVEKTYKQPAVAEQSKEPKTSDQHSQSKSGLGDLEHPAQEKAKVRQSSESQQSKKEGEGRQVIVSKNEQQQDNRLHTQDKPEQKQQEKHKEQHQHKQQEQRQERHLDVKESKEGQQIAAQDKTDQRSQDRETMNVGKPQEETEEQNEFSQEAQKPKQDERRQQTQAHQQQKPTEQPCRQQQRPTDSRKREQQKSAEQAEHSRPNTIQQQQPEAIESKHQSSTPVKKQQHQPKQQTQVEAAIQPYNKVSKQQTDFSRYDKQNKGYFTIQQFRQLAQQHNHTVEEANAQQVFDRFGSKEQITYGNATKYLHSVQGFGHLLDLKVEVWRQLNAFRNKLIQQGIKFDSIKDDSPSNHKIHCNLKSTHKPETELQLKLSIGKKSPDNQLKFQIQLPNRSPSVQQKLKSAVEQLKQQSHALDQLFQCLNTSISAGKNSLKLSIVSGDHLVIQDMIRDFQEYINSFGQNFGVDADISLRLVGKLSEAFEDTPLLKWMLRGFTFDCDLAGSSEWIKNFRKYLVATLRDIDKKLATYIYLLKNSNINFQFRSPEKVGDFLTRLGIANIVQKTNPLSKILTSDSKQPNLLQQTLQDVKKVLIPLISQEVTVRATLPSLNFELRMRGDQLSRFLQAVI